SEPAPVEHRHDLVADLEPLAARPDLGDDARRLGARRERQRRLALVLAGDHQGGGEAHARRLDADAHLPLFQWRWRDLLETQVLGPAPLAADHGFHSGPFFAYGCAHRNKSCDESGPPFRYLYVQWPQLGD